MAVTTTGPKNHVQLLVHPSVCPSVPHIYFACMGLKSCRRDRDGDGSYIKKITNFPGVGILCTWMFDIDYVTESENNSMYNC